MRERNNLQENIHDKPPETANRTDTRNFNSRLGFDVGRCYTYSTSQQNSQEVKSIRQRFLILTLAAVIVVIAVSAILGLGGLTPTPEQELKFTAKLSGGEEVPSVTTQAQGEATFNVSSDGSSIRYKLVRSNIENVTMAHIHQGAKGAAGPVVAWLYPATPPAVLIPGRSDGVLMEGTITASNLVGPLEGHPLSDLINEMKAGNTYVNIHTSQHAGGETRGQIG